MKSRKVQACISVSMSFSTEVPSSRGDSTYLVSGVFVEADGEVKCSCPAFTYRRSCRHLRLVKTPCGWTELSLRPQSIIEKSDCTCPECGARTISTVLAVDEYGLPLTKTVDKSSTG